MTDWRAAAALVRKIAENYKLPYYTISPTYSICADHGYLVGEQYVCPICGKKAEVYSRITGYYRPVQNWNDGKREEFKERKTYIVDGLASPDERAARAAARAEEAKAGADAAAKAKSVNADRLVLVTTTKCPNCAIAKRLMDGAGIAYSVVNADEDPAYAKQYGIRQAPTMLVFSGAQVTPLVGLSAIRGYLNQ